MTATTTIITDTMNWGTELWVSQVKKSVCTFPAEFAEKKTRNSVAVRRENCTPLFVYYVNTALNVHVTIVFCCAILNRVTDGQKRVGKVRARLSAVFFVSLVEISRDANEKFDRVRKRSKLDLESSALSCSAVAMSNKCEKVTTLQVVCVRRQGERHVQQCLGNFIETRNKTLS